MGAIVVKYDCIISPDWEGVIEGGFSNHLLSWVSLFENARKLEVRNWKFSVHYGAFIIVAIE